MTTPVVSQTEQQFLVTGSIAGKSMVFDTLSGTGNTAAPTRFRPGGMGREEVLAALGSYDDITVTKSYKVTEIQENLRYFLGLSQVGTAEMSVNDQPLDAGAAPIGKAITMTGRLVGVQAGNVDSQSGSPRMLTFTMAVETVA